MIAVVGTATVANEKNCSTFVGFHDDHVKKGVASSCVNGVRVSTMVQ